MSLTMTASSGSASTEKYADFENGVYLLELKKMEITESTKFKDKDGNAKKQVQSDFSLVEVEDPETGAPVSVRTWLGASLLPPNPESKSDLGKKGSFLWKVVKVISGHECQPDEEFDLETLYNGQCKAYVSLNDRGYPTINNETFAPAKKTMATKASPAKAAPPKPKAEAATISAEQVALIEEAWGKGEFEGELPAWVADNYTGRTLAQIRADEYDELAETLGVAPF